MTCKGTKGYDSYISFRKPMEGCFCGESYVCTCVLAFLLFIRFLQLTFYTGSHAGNKTDDTSAASVRLLLAQVVEVPERTSMSLRYKANQV